MSSSTASIIAYRWRSSSLASAATTGNRSAFIAPVCTAAAGDVPVSPANLAGSIARQAHLLPDQWRTRASWQKERVRRPDVSSWRASVRVWSGAGAVQERQWPGMILPSPLRFRGRMAGALLVSRRPRISSKDAELGGSGRCRITAGGLGELPPNDRTSSRRRFAIDPKEPVAVFSASDRSILEPDLRRSPQADQRWRQQSFAGDQHRPGEGAG